MITTITIKQPDDWHLHLRDGNALSSTVPHSAAHFARAVVMPNLLPPVTHVEHAISYRQQILANRSKGSTFDPLMTLYLTPKTTPEDIAAASNANIIGYKWYPAGATTNSEYGVKHIEALADTLAAMQQHQLPLLIHGEVTDARVDIFDREAQFIETVLKPLLQQYPNLKVVLEHITTQAAVEFINSASERVAATITAHHLLSNRNDLLAGGIKPHYYCLPILKREADRRALVMAACSGSPKFFLGTDSAPHAVSAKESACGCAGIYTAPHALALYTTVFEQQNALDKLEQFAAINGAAFYGLPVNEATVTLERKSWIVPQHYQFGDQQVVPFWAGMELNWQVV